MSKNDANNNNKKSTKERFEEARAYTKNIEFFKEPLKKSSFWQRLGAFFTGKTEELKQKDNIIDTIRGQIASNLTNGSTWHEGIKSSYEGLNVSDVLKKDFNSKIDYAKRIAMAKDSAHNNVMIRSEQVSLGGVKLENMKTQENSEKSQIPVINNKSLESQQRGVGRS